MRREPKYLATIEIDRFITDSSCDVIDIGDKTTIVMRKNGLVFSSPIFGAYGLRISAIQGAYSTWMETVVNS